jgi:hypothetical protein
MKLYVSYTYVTPTVQRMFASAEVESELPSDVGDVNILAERLLAQHKGEVLRGMPIFVLAWSVMRDKERDQKVKSLAETLATLPIVQSGKWTWKPGD